MNKIFKVVWSKVKHCYVVVSEIAKNTTSGGDRRSRMGKVSLAAAMAAAVLTGSFAMPNSALAASGVAEKGEYVAIKVQYQSADKQYRNGVKEDLEIKYGECEITNPLPDDVADNYEIVTIGDKDGVRADYFIRKGFDVVSYEANGNAERFEITEVKGSVQSGSILANTLTRDDNLKVNNTEVTTALGEVLRTTTTSPYVPISNGGGVEAYIKTTALWEYYIDVNGTKTNANTTTQSLFSEVKSKDGQFYLDKDDDDTIDTGEMVSFENVYFLKADEYADEAKSYVFFKTVADKATGDVSKIYTGNVTGGTGELLLTAQRETTPGQYEYVTYWAGKATDQNSLLADSGMTVGEFNHKFEVVDENIVKLGNADIREIIIDSDAKTVSLIRNNGASVDNSLVFGSGGGQKENGQYVDTYVTIGQEGDLSAIKIETGSKVVANSGEYKQDSTNVLKTISINEQTYTIQGGLSIADLGAGLKAYNEIEANANEKHGWTLTDVSYARMTFKDTTLVDLADEDIEINDEGTKLRDFTIYDTAGNAVVLEDVASNLELQGVIEEVAINTENITTLTEKVTANANSITSHNTRIQAIEDGYVTDATMSVNGNQENELTITKVNNGTESTISFSDTRNSSFVGEEVADNQATVTLTDSKGNPLTATITNIAQADDLSALVGRVTTNEEGIATNTSNITKNATDITTLTEKVTANTNSITSHNTRIQAIEDGYVKTASVSSDGSTLTLTKNNDETVTFTDTNNYVTGGSVSYKDNGEGTLTLTRDGMVEDIKISNLKNTYTTGASINGNAVQFNRNDGGSYSVNFTAGGGAYNGTDYKDTYVQIGGENGIKLNTGSLVRGEGKVVAGSGENKSLSKITINGEVFNVPLVVPNANVGTNDPNAPVLESINLNGVVYRVASFIEGEGHDYQLTGEINSTDSTNTPKGEQRGHYQLDESGSLRLNMLEKLTGNVEVGKIVVDGIASRDYVDGAIATEKAEREAADVDLNNRITDEVRARETADVDLSNRITDEVRDREAVDTVLSDRITDETRAREEADADLSNRITDEVRDREAADTVLSDRITDETRAREEADADLSNRITDEVRAREEADAVLSDRITDETRARETADADLSNRITDEVRAREEADAVLSDRITDETRAREEADAVLSDRITDETRAREEADAVLSDRITDETRAREEADAVLSDRITDETRARETADADLNNRITDEIVAREAIDTDLSNRITDEVRAREANDIVSGNIASDGKVTLTKGDNSIIAVGTITDYALDNQNVSVASDGTVSLTATNIYNENDKRTATITDVASKKVLDKEISDRIAVDNYLYETMNKNDQYLDSKINQLGSKVNKVGAGAAALAALHPMDFDPDDKLSFAVGAGNYAGETATALGAFYRPNEKVMMNVAGTYGNGENMVNMGVSFALDRTNNVSNSRTAMAREIVDLREQVATQGQQIAQLIALVNQLAGTPAAKNPAEVLFPDIPENHWAYEYIHSLADRGIVEGYPDGNFGGDRTMTRYEFATMLFKAMQKGVVLSEQIRQEFEKELGRIRVDCIKGADDDANKIERVRVNTAVDRDDYGSKVVQVKH